MGDRGHFCPDAAFSPEVPTHYFNLPHHVALFDVEVASLALLMGEQRSAWRWVQLQEAAGLVHPYVKPYVSWLQTTSIT